MSRYSQDDEERIRAQAQVREWARSSLLDAGQGAGLEAELRVDVRRTNGYLRAALALFTALIVFASVLFVTTGLSLTGNVAVAVVTGVAAVVCFGLAELLVGRFRLYRFGVEEGLAVAAALLLAACASELVRNPQNVWMSLNVVLVVAAAGGFGVYRRFGFVYAAIGGMVCAACLPLQIYPPDLSPITRHVLAAVPFAAVFVIVRPKRLRDKDDYPGDDYGLLQAAAWAGLYLFLNLELAAGLASNAYAGTGVLYWFTYVMIWLLPLAGLRWGIRDKDRELMNVSIVMALITLVTNKPYLGWPRNSWDPILLGLFLMILAAALRRWLSTGPNGARGGFTSTRVLQKDSAMLTLISTAAAAFQPNAPATHRDPAAPGFAGGRSGGAGGGASY